MNAALRYRCPGCGETTTQCYRCEHCGKDLADDSLDAFEVASTEGER